MKTFVQTLYDYNFVGTVTKDFSDKEDEMTIGIVSESHPHGDQQLVGYSDIIGRVNEKDDSDEEDETEIAVSEWPPPHGDWQRESCSDSNSDREPCSSKQQSILDEDFDEKIDLVLVSK